MTEHRIEGRNAVIEAMRVGREIDKILINSEGDSTLGHIAAKARDLGITVVKTDRRKLDSLSETGSHQGVIAFVAATTYATVEDMLELARERGEKPLIVICDELSDPHNLGAIVRTADAAGAHGVIIPKRRSATLTATVAKASAGAIEHVLIAKVPNITATIKELKEQGIWVYGAAAEGSQSMYKADFADAAAIVIGNEGEGLGRLVRENCDVLVSIPMKGGMSSLNASNAAAVLLYEAVRQRIG
ncbi:MAG: 23S rRNA (guanosine(2251)-2'-O)-methyltransferase RlmB [Oscillospiraceae bacterium]|nr:23S rRNA (guanosine(2251)-2'-O)-methyltransferase RlmB [Oscillospiraceae bacterium]